MEDYQTISVIVPLVYLIVLKISDVSREINLIEKTGNKGWPIFSPATGIISFAPLGRFTYLHTLNYVILLSTFATTAYLLEGPALDVLMYRTGPLLLGLLGAFTFFVWLFFPLFEIDEYGEVSSDGIPESITHHIGSVTLTAVYLMWAIYLYNQTISGNNSLIPLGLAVAAIFFSMIYFRQHSPHILLLFIFAIVPMFAVRLYLSNPIPIFTLSLGSVSIGLVAFVNAFLGIELFLQHLNEEIVSG